MLRQGKGRALKCHYFPIGTCLGAFGYLPVADEGFAFPLVCFKLGRLRERTYDRKDPIYFGRPRR